jgi:hypothetical protein
MSASGTLTIRSLLGLCTVLTGIKIPYGDYPFENNSDCNSELGQASSVFRRFSRLDDSAALYDPANLHDDRDRNQDDTRDLAKRSSTDELTHRADEQHKKHPDAKRFL